MQTRCTLHGTTESVHAQQWPTVEALSWTRAKGTENLINVVIMVRGKRLMEAKVADAASDEAVAQAVNVPTQAVAGLTRKVVRKPNGSMVITYF